MRVLFQFVPRFGFDGGMVMWFECRRRCGDRGGVGDRDGGGWWSID